MTANTHICSGSAADAHLPASDTPASSKSQKLYLIFFGGGVEGHPAVPSTKKTTKKLQTTKKKIKGGTGGMERGEAQQEQKVGAENCLGSGELRDGCELLESNKGEGWMRGREWGGWEE